MFYKTYNSTFRVAKLIKRKPITTAVETQMIHE